MNVGVTVELTYYGGITGPYIGYCAADKQKLGNYTSQESECRSGTALCAVLEGRMKIAGNVCNEAAKRSTLI
jgi:hypothetical protein